MLGMKCKHPYLADAEYAKLSFQLQISCDICNKLPVMRVAAYPQRNPCAEFLPSLSPSLWRTHTFQQEAKLLRWKHSHSLLGLWSNPGALWRSRPQSSPKCLRRTGQANTSWKGGSWPPHTNSLTSILSAEEERPLVSTLPLRKQADLRTAEGQDWN